MRALAPWAVLLLFGTGVVSAQSLAEVAKKEKDRRGTRGREPIPVIGDEELSSARGDGLSVTGRIEPIEPIESLEPLEQDPSEPEPSPANPGDDPDSPDSPDARELQLTDAEVREYRESWARIWAERLEAAEEELELAKDAVFQCQSAAHYVFVPLGVDCSGVFERRAIAEYRLKETRQNRYNWELLLPERQRPPPPQ